MNLCIASWLCVQIGAFVICFDWDTQKGILKVCECGSVLSPCAAIFMSRHRQRTGATGICAKGCRTAGTESVSVYVNLTDLFMPALASAAMLSPPGSCVPLAEARSWCLTKVSADRQRESEPPALEKT